MTTTEDITFVITEQPVVFQVVEQPIIFDIGEGIPLMMNAMDFNSGTKSSATDTGFLGEVSFDNDHLFICVQAGAAGFAVWKQFYGVET